MKSVITIVKNPTSNGYEWSLRSGDGKTLIRRNRVYGDGPEAAAALAVEKAIGFGAHGFVIMAPREVMDCIPPEFRYQDKF